MIKTTYLVQGNKTIQKFTTMHIEELANVFQVESIVNNGDHYILRVPAEVTK